MELIYNGNSQRSGVYRLLNRLNGRFYIGSAKEFKRRWRQHAKQLARNKHSNAFLQADFNKCGEEAFVFEVLKVVEGPQELRLAEEQVYIDQLYDNQQQCYNLTRSVNKRAPSCNSYTPEESKAKFRASTLGKKLWSEEEKKEISERLKGHHVSEATRQKLREKNLGKKHSEETKKKISESNVGKHRERLLSPEIRAKAIEAARKALTGKAPWNKGMKCTPEQCQQISERVKEWQSNHPEQMAAHKLVNVGRKQSVETKTKRSKKLQKLIRAICVETGEEVVFQSIKEAIASTGVSETSIYRVLDGKAESAKGYRFEMISPRRKIKKPIPTQES